MLQEPQGSHCKAVSLLGLPLRKEAVVSHVCCLNRGCLKTRLVLDERDRAVGRYEEIRDERDQLRAELEKARTEVESEVRRATNHALHAAAQVKRADKAEADLAAARVAMERAMHLIVGRKYADAVVVLDQGLDYLPLAPPDPDIIAVLEHARNDALLVVGALESALCGDRGIPDEVAEVLKGAELIAKDSAAAIREALNAALVKLRGDVLVASGKDLDDALERAPFHLRREPGEPDADYRERALAKVRG